MNELLSRLETNGIPQSIFDLFVASLFVNGKHTIYNGMKIVDWNNNDNGYKNPIWEQNKSDFIKYGLIETVELKHNNSSFNQMSYTGSDIWRQITRIKKEVVQPVKHIEQDSNLKLVEYRYKDISTEDLQTLRDAKENERLSIMREVAKLQATNARNKTSTCTKEFYGEKLAKIVSDIDLALQLR